MKNKFYLSFLFSLLCVVTATTDVTDGETQNTIPDKPDSSCLKKGKMVYEALPGMGWDNLRNEEQSLVVLYNYSQCHVTKDGKFILPDNVFEVPEKSSKLATFSEVFDHWKDYKTMTSTSINAHAGLSLKTFGISGSFSSEKSSVREHQERDDSVSTRVQLRYVLYRSMLQPGFQLHPSFKERLLKIASFIEMNDTRMVDYKCQLLVRDFGTHLITRVNAGAVLAKLDQVKSRFVKSFSQDISVIGASASASFSNVFNIGGSASHSVSKTVIDQYVGNLTHSSIETLGGPPYLPENFSINDWVLHIPENMVDVDKFGDPLYFVITTENLPELPPFTVYDLQKSVKKSIETYYAHNVYKGCMKRDSPNFNFIANVDDDSCKNPSNNYTFGGVYQECSQQGYLPGKNLCSGLTQDNPITGGKSCPDGYEPYLLHSNTIAETSSERRCHSCWVFAHCCNTDYHSAKATYHAYWCAAKHNVPADSGYLFGGLYTSKSINLFTGSQACPPNYNAMKILSDLHICVSVTYDLGYEYDVPFAGFFSCSSGNPLKLDSDKADSNEQNSNLVMLNSFLESSGPSHWPKDCPKGYSALLATIVDSCNIEYCVKSDTLRSAQLPPVNLPPFMDPPSSAYTDKESDFYMISDNGLNWTMLQQKDALRFSESTKEGETPTQFPTSAIVVITCLSLMILILSIVLGKVASKKRRAARGFEGSINSTSPIIDRQNGNENVQNYGTQPESITA